MSEPEDLTWNGRLYRRWPEHSNRSQRVYFMATTAPRSYLHRDIYEAATGERIPDGWHVHHLDHNPDNNDPSNLAAVSPSEHAEHHGSNRDLHTLTCAGCAEPFASPRSWAKWCSAACKERTRRAEGTASVRPRSGPWREMRSCGDCGCRYVAKRPWSRFCSPTCKQRHARREKATA